jgi:hypothetical protein
MFSLNITPYKVSDERPAQKMRNTARKKGFVASDTPEEIRYCKYAYR